MAFLDTALLQVLRHISPLNVFLETIPNNYQKLIYINFVRNKRLVKEFIDKPMLIVARKQNEI